MKKVAIELKQVADREVDSVVNSQKMGEFLEKYSSVISVARRLLFILIEDFEEFRSENKCLFIYP